MSNLKTRLHTYNFDTRKPDDAAAYKALVKALKATSGRGHKMHSIPSGNGRSQQARAVELETAHVFSNQWNTADGHRVFDWYEAAVFDNGREMTHRKWGHYLDITPEMVALRQDQLVCGYCGTRHAQSDGAVIDSFCDKCLDSPYLKAGELHLLRLRPVAEHFPERASLTVAESAELLPRYAQRQTTGADSRNAQKLAKQRERVELDYRRAIAAATAKHDGLLWLMDRGVGIDNCIYYSHTDIFCFGWRSPVSEAVRSSLLDALVEFPFNYEIKVEA